MRQYQLDTKPRIIVKSMEYVKQILIEQTFGIAENRIRLPKNDAVIDELIEILKQAKA